MPNTASSGSVDLRVVEFIKASSSSPLREQISPEGDNYVCLGHFDRLHIRAVEETGNALSSIEHDYTTRQGADSNYTYPLYILHYPTEKDTLDAFWDARLCCAAVSRVHFDPLKKREAKPGKTSKEQDIEDLQTSLRALSGELPADRLSLGETTVFVDNELVHCVFYHTLELGDIVVVLKSNSMVSCLHVLQRLLETASVGDVYSYCGIHTALFQENSAAEAAKKWDEACKDRPAVSMRSAEAAMAELLPHASVRFSIRSARCAKTFWDLLLQEKADSVAFVTGTADAIVDLSGYAFGSFIDYIRGLLMNNYPFSDDPGETRFFDMYDAFDDVITRIGVPYGSIYAGAKLPGQSRPPEAVQNIQQALRNAVLKMSEHTQQNRWAPALIAQTNTLITMMGNCVMDDLSMLIWPSVQALLERLANILGTSSAQLGELQETDIRLFLNGWDILANDVTQLEGQLVQSPEVQSSRYYTPVTLMAFYMALLHEYNTLLLEINGDKNRQNFIPLVTHDIQPRANTRCILDTGNGAGADSYQGSIPLLVSLPVSLMYHPFDVSVILCHEMSHYSGDATRLREERLDHILFTCAGRIAAAWQLDGRSAYPLCDGGSLAVVRSIFAKLQTGYKKRCQNKNAGNGWYISQIRDILPSVLKQVYLSQDLQSSLLCRYLKEDALQRTFVQYAKTFTPMVQLKVAGELTSRLHDLLLLYRECYADLAAVLCLGLSKKEYLWCMFYWEERYLGASAPSAEPSLSQNKLYFQAALVLTAAKTWSGDPAPQSVFTTGNPGWLEDRGARVQAYQDAIKTGKDIMVPDNPGEQLAIPAEYLPLEAYLKSCARELTKDFQRPKIAMLRKKLRSMLSAVLANPNFRELHDMIAKYRESLFQAESH